MTAIALLVGLALGSPPDPPECRNPPSRVSDSYWSFIEACGCAKLDPPSRASSDYDRFLKACSQWRERNPRVIVGARRTSRPPECRNPPSRASDSYWGFIDACGCADLEPPSRASADYDRFLKACSEWRERNPQADVIDPSTPPSAKPSLAPTPSPGASPEATPRP